MPLEHGPSRRRFRLGFVKRFRRDEDGATAIEFAFVAIPFFALLFAIVESAIVFWTQQVLETALHDSARRIYTGQFQNDNPGVNDPAQLEEAFRAEVCSRVVALFDCEGTLRLDVRNFSDFSGISFGSVVTDEGEFDDDAFTFERSQAGQVVIVRAAIAYPVFTGVLDSSGSRLADGRRLLMASAAFRTEPFAE
ncbi:TadE/TadG family type IV pilus assembly protein [Salinarimonas ramus]|uniref:Pilus biosynthesis protein TadE n=1 Tax=Salinarimonas ramus TaxID=690164 RepID=A0A917V3Q5_9HYPH|nr:TadE/TadG family type IV pilus assembly protein [Salinarimonas ramus]GGK32014.1 pilus biosynthesis protein TadE [Salinarimonas ramus]